MDGDARHAELDRLLPERERELAVVEQRHVHVARGRVDDAVRRVDLPAVHRALLVPCLHPLELGRALQRVDGAVEHDAVGVRLLQLDADRPGGGAALEERVDLDAVERDDVDVGLLEEHRGEVLRVPGAAVLGAGHQVAGLLRLERGVQEAVDPVGEAVVGRLRAVLRAVVVTERVGVRDAVDDEIAFPHCPSLRS